MTIIARVYSILTRRQQHKAILLIGIMVLGACLEAVGIGAIWPLIQIIADENYLLNHPKLANFLVNFNVMTNKELVIFSSFFLIVFYLLKNVFMAMQVRVQTTFTIRNQIDSAKKLLAYYLSKPYLFHVEHNSAILYRNIDIGSNAIYSQLAMSILSLITEIITAIVIWIMVAFIDPLTAILAAVLLAGIICLIMIKLRNCMAHKGHIKYEYSAQYLKWLNQALGSIKETKVMQKEHFFLYNFNEAYTRFGLASGDYIFLNQLPRMVIEGIVIVAMLVLIVCKILMGDSPRDIVAVLSVLALAAFRLMPCANRIVGFWGTIKFHTPLFNDLYDDYQHIKKQASDIDTGTGEFKNLLFKTSIIFKNVTFQYPETIKPVLHDINLIIPKGTFVGIIGSTGSGKTTLVDLLLGLLKPNQGKIEVDGKNIAENLNGWLRHLAYVPQNVYLFDGTIKNNIALGDINYSDAKLIRVLEMAEIYDFVKTLPEGVDTAVGERGAKLSGGQRQRIGIARALYCEPDVLILDEATSALDSDVERSITQTLLRLKGKITIISIAHRLTTLENCDFKVKVEQGNALILINQ